MTSSSMAKQTPSTTSSLIALLLLLSILTVEGAKKSYGVYQNNDDSGSVKLFVFGDSYLDTGNFVTSGSYKPPSGMTYPGYPAGRFSDGRVLTDYIASYLKIETPVAYAFSNASNVQYGINFAYGGTGLSDTLVDGPNMTVQINSFERLIQHNVFTKQDLQSSVALVNAGSNDYTTHLKHGGFTDIPKFSDSLVEQMSADLKRIQSLGVGKVGVTLLQPLGCLPVLTILTLHESCIGFVNDFVETHNQELQDSVAKMNQEIGQPVFTTIDLYSSFKSTIETMQKARETNSSLMNPLVQCCVGPVKDGGECGVVDDQGNKLYSVCDDPGESLFWDVVHPSQNGWNAIYNWLEPSLGNLTHKIF